VKNRKSETIAVRCGAFLTTALLCSLFVGAGLGYVWHRNRNEQLRGQIEQKRARLESLRMQNQAMERQVEDLRSHRALERRVQDLGLGLVMPVPEQILRLTEHASSAAPLPTPSARILAEQTGPGRPAVGVLTSRTGALQP